MIFTSYTDGSCRNNGSKNAVGAWGYIIMKDDSGNRPVIEDYQIEKNTTNQRMELMACAQACQKISDLIGSGFDEIHIYTDSAYLHNCYSQKWYVKWQSNGFITSKNEPVLNKDLWEKLIPYFENYQFKFHKTAGHANDFWNNYVDDKVQKLTLKEKNNVSNNNTSL